MPANLVCLAFALRVSEPPTVEALQGLLNITSYWYSCHKRYLNKLRGSWRPECQEVGVCWVPTSRHPVHICHPLVPQTFLKVFMNVHHVYCDHPPAGVHSSVGGDLDLSINKHGGISDQQLLAGLFIGAFDEVSPSFAKSFYIFDGGGNPRKALL